MLHEINIAVFQCASLAPAESRVENEQKEFRLFQDERPALSLIAGFCRPAQIIPVIYNVQQSVYLVVCQNADIFVVIHFQF